MKHVFLIMLLTGTLVASAQPFAVEYLLKPVGFYRAA
jgi:hypothetical protein